jgi:hypothetical protein
MGYGVGMTIGPILSGAMQVQLGFGLPFALGGLCYLAGAGVIWLCLRRGAAEPAPAAREAG